MRADFDDLSVIEPDDLMEMGGLTAEAADHITEQAEARAEEPTPAEVGTTKRSTPSFSATRAA